MGALDLVLGPMLLGICFNLILYGLMVMQTYSYFLQSKRDPTWMKYMVGFLFLADTLNSGFHIALLWDFLIVNFGVPEGVSKTTWVFSLDPSFTATISLTVHSFFAWRVKKLTGLTWITILILGMTTVQFLGGIGTSIGCSIVKNFVDLQKIEVVVILWLGFAALTDIVITTTLVWYLRSNKTGFAVTDDLISKLIRLTVQTGAITTIVAIINLVTYLTIPNTIHLIFNYPLCKLYTNSLLSTLNARVRREIGSRSGGNSSAEAARPPVMTTGKWKGQPESETKSGMRKSSVLAGINVTTHSTIHKDGYEIELSSRPPTNDANSEPMDSTKSLHAGSGDFKDDSSWSNAV